MRSAKLLIEDGDYDSSVSRAYYAMFYLAEALLSSIDISFSSHKGVISGFGEQFVKTGIFKKEFSKALTQAFEKRQLAEYDHRSITSKEEAEEIFKKAEGFFTETQKYFEKKESG
jgi:uncharacterized protein (UPF0332 family)